MDLIGWGKDEGAPGSQAGGRFWCGRTEALLTLGAELIEWRGPDGGAVPPCCSAACGRLFDCTRRVMRSIAP